MICLSLKPAAPGEPERLLIGLTSLELLSVMAGERIGSLAAVPPGTGDVAVQVMPIELMYEWWDREFPGCTGELEFRHAQAAAAGRPEIVIDRREEAPHG